MMAEAASAAYQTVPEGFILDSLQTHFMLSPSPTEPLVYRVQRLSQGRRFGVRLVHLEQQQNKICATVTMSFVSGAAWTGPAMTHSETRQNQKRVPDITLDDFQGMRSRLGPFMKFERLPHVHRGKQTGERNASAYSFVC
jgi:acyl-CoA thioesterase II